MLSFSHLPASLGYCVSICRLSFSRSRQSTRYPNPSPNLNVAYSLPHNYTALPNIVPPFLLSRLPTPSIPPSPRLSCPPRTLFFLALRTRRPRIQMPSRSENEVQRGFHAPSVEGLFVPSDPVTVLPERSFIRLLTCSALSRLKLRCDRAIPCGSCVKRGCAAICPDGVCPPSLSLFFSLI